MANAQRTVKRVLLGHEITYLRTRLKMSQSDLGKAIGKGQGKIALLEQGEATLTPDELTVLLDALQVNDPAHRDAIAAIHQDSHKRGEWTTGFNRAFGDNLRLFIELERHADQIFYSAYEIVPGILQCESYVRSLFRRGRAPEGVTEEPVIQAWMTRKDILMRADAPTAHFVISESSLRRKWASSKIMREQMEYLLAMSHLPSVLLQVLPFDASEHDLHTLGHGFTLFRLPAIGHAGDLRMAYNEGVGEFFYRDDPRVINTHEEDVRALAAAALSPDDSRQFIQYVAGSFL